MKEAIEHIEGVKRTITYLQQAVNPTSHEGALLACAVADLTAAQQLLSAVPSPAGDEEEVERVKAAIDKARDRCYESCSEYTLDQVNDAMARAALSAMRQAPQVATVDGWQDGDFNFPPVAPGDNPFKQTALNRPAPKLTEEDRARVEEVRVVVNRWKAYPEHLVSASVALGPLANALSLIDKLTGEV